MYHPSNGIVLREMGEKPLHHVLVRFIKHALVLHIKDEHCLYPQIAYILKGEVRTDETMY